MITWNVNYYGDDGNDGTYNFKEENWVQDEYYYYIPGTLDIISNPNSLYSSYLKCRKTVAWKPSVQRFGLNILSNIVAMRNQIESGNYKPSTTFEFKLNERGHERDIKALRVFDRVIQRSLNDNILVPRITPYLIYNNGASQTDKGITFSRNQFTYHLHNAFMEFGPDAYVLLIDFSKYFDNILHEELLEYMRPLLSDEEFAFVYNIFDSFDIDVSYMSDEEYQNCLSNLFNSLEYSAIDKSLLTGEKMMKKSVSIGNQSSQIAGIFYPHQIDNYCTIVKGYRYYARYMDDTYVIAKTKEELIQLLNEIESICTTLGIHINKKKTRIQPLMSEISFLKINYILSETGAVRMKVPSETFIRERRHLKKFKGLLDQGRMSIVDILQCFLSWYGSYIIYDSKYKVHEMEIYFKELFGIRQDVDLSIMVSELIKQDRNKIKKDILRCLP